MKSLTLFLLIISFSLHAAAREKSDKEKDGLFGLVRTVEIEVAEVTCRNGGCVEKQRSVLSKEGYDRSGRLTGNRNRFAVNDPISQMVHYPFDEKLRSITVPTYREDGSLLYTDVYNYDNQSRRSEHFNYDADYTLSSRDFIFFNEQGRIAKTLRYDKDNVLVEREEINYDTMGNEIESVFYKEDGSVIEARDESGIYLKRLIFDYEFDGTGNWIKSTISKFVNKSGLYVLEPSFVKYRTITYY
jgi:hypothetical protein